MFRIENILKNHKEGEFYKFVMSMDASAAISTNFDK